MIITLMKKLAVWAVVKIDNGRTVKAIWKKFTEWFVIKVGSIHWSYKGGLTTEELATLRTMLTADYYIILTRRKNHLSTLFVAFAELVLSGKWGYWGHVLMNLEDEVNSKTDFRLVEATGKGVNYAPFDLVFMVHSVALIKPKSMSVTQWTKVLDRAKSNLGKPYDTLFDITNDSALSCVELVRTALMAEDNYYTNFAHFEEMIKSRKNLSPQMFFDCPDFEIVYEIRR